MRITLLNLLLLILFSSSIFGQEKRDWQWVFGEDGGVIIDFNSGALEVIHTSKEMEMEATSVSICDTTGRLLFYTNGCYIANSNNEIMENGDSIGMGYLESSFCESGGSPLNQGSLILPKPESDGLYYVFYHDIEAPYELPPGMYFPLAPERLFYSVVDINFNNGLGKVIEKNQIIIQDTFARFGIQAVKHSNDLDWWLITPKSHSNCYFKTLLTSDGVQTPTSQCIGNVWDDIDAQGQSVFSPDGQKYVRFIYDNGLNIFDFDTSNGTLSNPIHISFDQDEIFDFAGVAFSSNSRFLYATAYTKVYQFDLFATDIENSKTLIAELAPTPPDIQFNTRFYKARLAPDGKIYIGGTNQFNHLHVIHNPNCPGSLCNIQQYAVRMDVALNFSSFTMPNFPHFTDWDATEVCDSTITTIAPEATFNCVQDSLNPFLYYFTDGSSNIPNSWLWDFGDSNITVETNPSHTFPGIGTYEICLTVSNDAGIDSICKTIELQLIGTQDPKNKLLFSIYPNPAKEKIILHFPNDIISRLEKWEIFNNIGQLVVSNKARETHQIVHTSNWNSGVYFIRVFLSDGLTEVRRIVIQP